MRLIPCIICEEESEAIDNKAIAKVCDTCNNKKDLSPFLKMINYRKVMKLINDKKLKLTKDGELI